MLNRRSCLLNMAILDGCSALLFAAPPRQDTESIVQAQVLIIYRALFLLWHHFVSFAKHILGTPCKSFAKQQNNLQSNKINYKPYFDHLQTTLT